MYITRKTRKDKSGILTIFVLCINFIKKISPKLMSFRRRCVNYTFSQRE